MLTADMEAIVDSSKLGFVATVCEDGSPNLSPKGSIRVYDQDHLVFADIASPNTIENLRRRSADRNQLRGLPATARLPVQRNRAGHRTGR